MADGTSYLNVEIGDTGLKRSWGYVTEEFLPQLKGRKAVEVYREMGDNDPIVGSVLYALEQIVRQVTWNSVGPNAGFVENCRGDMSHTWEDFLAEVLSELQYGWAYHEIVYKLRPDGRVGWRKLPIRSQDTLWRWEFDDNGGVQGMYQVCTGTGTFFEAYVPISKALLFRTTSRKNNPQGRSVLRTAYRPWHFKKRIEEIEAIGVERDLAGIPKIGVPPELLAANASTEHKTALAQFKKLGEDLRNDEQSCVIYPLAYDESGHELYKIELMGSGGRREFVTGDIISRKGLEIAQSALADVILLGHESVGSHALAASKEEMLLTGVQSIVDGIAAVFNKHALPKLFALNGIEDTETKIVAGELQSANMTDISNIIWKLAAAGMPFFPSESLEEHLRALMDLPGKEGDEVVINPGTGVSGEPGGALSYPVTPAKDVASGDQVASPPPGQ